MKQCLLFLSAILVAGMLNAQNVGIGTTTPASSAMLEINSSNKGLLLPRVTDTTSVTSPVKGLTIYNNKNNKLWYYDGSRWQQAAANGGGMDSIWFKTRDSIAYTQRSYIGINTDLSLFKPQANLQMVGSLLVQDEFQYSTNSPTVAQTYTMNSQSSYTTIGDGDSVFRIYDPSGASGNYASGSQGNVRFFNDAYQTAFKVSSVAADWGIGSGDTLWISEFSYPACRTSYTYRFLANSPDPGEFMLQSNTYYISFRANLSLNDKGFNFKVTRLYSRSPFAPQYIAGSALYYNAAHHAFTAGENCRTTTGIAMGINSRSANSATAIGNDNYAGSSSFAIGNFAEARGYRSFAIGNSAKTSGEDAIALGRLVDADGMNSIVLGNESEATGDYAVALGYSANASGYYSFAVGGSAQGSYSKSFGGTANGISSVAFRGEANGEGAISLARFGIANAAYGLVVGQFNQPLFSNGQDEVSPGTPLFMIGNGTGLSASDRSNAMVVLQNGNVGIGSNFPADRLVLNDAAGGTTMSLQSNGVEKGFVQLSGNNIRLGVYSSNDLGNVVLRSNGTDQFTLFPSGNATLQGTLTQSSDARFKQNIRPIENALDKIKQLNGYEYNWKPELKKDSAVQIGLIAQNVEAVLPQLVSTDSEGMKSVAYQNLVAVLVEGMKEQQQQITELVEVMKKQQKRIEELEKKPKK